MTLALWILGLSALGFALSMAALVILLVRNARDVQAQILELEDEPVYSEWP